MRRLLCAAAIVVAVVALDAAVVVDAPASEVVAGRTQRAARSALTPETGALRQPAWDREMPEPQRAPPPPRTATVIVGGDVLIHSQVARQAGDEATARGHPGYDFTAMLGPIAPRLRGADLALCHLETPLSTDNEGLSGYPVFEAPRELAGALGKAGVDGCSVASNHALDRGAGGVGATLDVLDAAGLGHAGTARSAEEAARPVIYDAGGIRVGHLSYTYGFNGFQVPADRPWLANAIEPARIIADAASARAAGAEVVMASLHWGLEYHHDPTSEQQALAEQLAASGAVDVVVGHHAHVVQPITRIGRMWVVYGLGNLLSNNATRCCPAETIDGLLVTISLEGPPGRVAVTGVTFTPTYNERTGFRVLPVVDALADPTTPPALAAELHRSWERTNGYVLALGAGTLGARPG